MRVVLAGATGTVGRATAAALAARGHEVIALVRPGSVPPGGVSRTLSLGLPALPEDVSDARKDTQADALVSCLASRTGAPADAWAVDHDAHVVALEAALAAGVEMFVLLSAICVQKPLLAFQHAKLAFEDKLIRSGLGYAIVRPTAYFKSLSGQIARVRAGKRFLLFGDGELTACKPISDRDLAAFIVDRLDDPRDGRGVAARPCVAHGHLAPVHLCTAGHRLYLEGTGGGEHQHGGEHGNRGLPGLGPGLGPDQFSCEARGVPEAVQTP